MLGSTNLSKNVLAPKISRGEIVDGADEAVPRLFETADFLERS